MDSAKEKQQPEHRAILCGLRTNLLPGFFANIAQGREYRVTGVEKKGKAKVYYVTFFPLGYKPDTCTYTELIGKAMEENSGRGLASVATFKKSKKGVLPTHP